MQDWREQAQKNNIICESGDCQFCGAPLEEGVSQCVDISSMITFMISQEEGISNMTIFMCVDSHALQHSEIHGRWNNHFHLSRLELILNDKIPWNYKLSPLLSNVVNDYKKSNKNEFIVPPEPKKRGNITAYSIANAESEEQYIHLVNDWAKSVYDSFLKDQVISKKIAKLFREKYNM